MPRRKRSRRAGRAVREGRARYLESLRAKPRVVSVQSISDSLVRLVISREDAVHPPVIGPWARESPRSPSPSFGGPDQSAAIPPEERAASWTDPSRAWSPRTYIPPPAGQQPGGTIPFKDPRYEFHAEAYFARTGCDSYPPYEARRLSEKGIIWADLWGP